MTTAIARKNDKQAQAPSRTHAPRTPRPAPLNADAPCYSKRFSDEWLLRTTLRNSLRACVAARRSSYLRVPQVLRVDAEALRIDYEYLDGWLPVRSVIRHRTFRGLPGDALRRMFWTIGAALDEFHRHTRRIHGDFDFDNIFVRAGAAHAAFIDFTPPDYANYREYNLRDPYWDIAMFVLSVRAKYPPHRIHLALRPQTRELARAFIEGYFHARDTRFDPRALKRRFDEILDTTYLGRSFSGRYLRRSTLYRTDDLEP